LLDADLSLDRLDDARKVAQQLRTLGIGAARIHQRFLEMAYIEEDQSAAATEIQWYAASQKEYLSFGLQAAHQNVAGQRRESSKLYKRATDTALRQGLKDVAAGFEEADARADALSGNCTTVRHLAGPRWGWPYAATSLEQNGSLRKFPALPEWCRLECSATPRDPRSHRTPARTARLCH